jgi:hypothetical protein
VRFCYYRKEKNNFAKETYQEGDLVIYCRSILENFVNKKSSPVAALSPLKRTKVVMTGIDCTQSLINSRNICPILTIQAQKNAFPFSAVWS